MPLCSKNEYTKSESNSQHHNINLPRKTNCVQRTNIQNLKAIHNAYERYEDEPTDCVQRTNIQNLKAIHNTIRYGKSDSPLCSKNEYTKSESNSQPLGCVLNTRAYCVQRTNIQNLKAIHNVLERTLY